MGGVRYALLILERRGHAHFVTSEAREILLQNTLDASRSVASRGAGRFAWSREKIVVGEG